MCEFVGDGEWQKLLEGHSESFEKCSASERVRIKQRFLKKRLSSGQNRKGWTIRLPPDLAENRFPILRSNENPGPFAKRSKVEFCKNVAQPRQLFLALADTEPLVAMEPQCWGEIGVDLRPSDDHPHYARLPQRGSCPICVDYDHGFRAVGKESQHATDDLIAPAAGWLRWGRRTGERHIRATYRRDRYDGECERKRESH
jgi:hypothetical protein